MALVVPGEARDAIALLDAELGEHAREPVDALGERGVLMRCTDPSG